MTQDAVSGEPIKPVLVADLAALVPVRAGRIEHKTVMNADGARLVVLALDAGEVLKEHRSPHPLLMQVVNGRVRIAAGGEDFDLAPGAVLHLGAAVPHAVQAMEPAHLVLTLLTDRPVRSAADG
jgi:quercetin dioxygenase-like cupin family protein